MKYFNSMVTKQHESELEALCEKVGFLVNVIDIGTYKGGTASVWAGISSGKVITIDRKFSLPLCFEGKEFEERIHKIEGISQSEEMEKRVSEILGGEKVDLLFIDGGHIYAEAERDFRIFLKFVSPGKWIAFHDIINNDVDVPKFWSEIKTKYESYEFIIQEQPTETQRTIWGIGKGNYNGIGLIKWKD